MKTKVAKPTRIRTENQASTCPAKYTPIKLKEKAHNKVIDKRYDITTQADNQKLECNVYRQEAKII
ncbi:hypothetical protein AHAT_07250 [Agarivorans sp. Toyoura001]|nr:hypothetical protein AHAT_07250 [Agarivorans sp. Toyoura001]